MMTKMTTNSCWDNQLEEIRRRVHQRQIWQDVRAKQVVSDGLEKNWDKRADFSGERSTNSLLGNEMGTDEGRTSGSVLGNALASNDLCGSGGRRIEQNSQQQRAKTEKRKKLISVPTFARWWKFNFVGAIGIGVQFAALFFLKSVFGLNYLAATALAVEAAVMHNFVWHEQFTWADRVRPDRETAFHITPLPPSRAKACNRLGSPFAALKRCATQDLRDSSFARLVRFHLGNGAVSILGNLALMKVMVGQGHMNYLVANAIAMVMCSIANFLVSDRWVFES